MIKNILIVIEKIGENEKIDSKVKEIVKAFADENELHIYAKEVILNEIGEYIRMKGVIIHTQSVTLITNVPKEYDAILAFDAWAMKSAGLFNASKKIKVGEKTKLFDISRELNKKESAKK